METMTTSALRETTRETTGVSAVSRPRTTLNASRTTKTYSSRFQIRFPRRVADGWGNGELDSVPPDSPAASTPDGGCSDDVQGCSTAKTLNPVHQLLVEYEVVGSTRSA